MMGRYWQALYVQSDTPGLRNGLRNGCAVNAVVGDDAKVQRCRNHKNRVVAGHLPKDPQELARLTIGTTKIIDSSYSWACQKIHRVTNWQSGEMEVRWTALAKGSLSKNLKAGWQPNDQNQPLAKEVEVGYKTSLTLNFSTIGGAISSHLTGSSDIITIMF